MTCRNLLQKLTKSSGKILISSIKTLLTFSKYKKNIGLKFSDLNQNIAQEFFKNNKSVLRNSLNLIISYPKVLCHKN